MSTNKNLISDSDYSNAVIVPIIGIFELMRGLKQYELSNHLGNVLSVVTDQNLPDDDNGSISYFLAEVISYSDYYPFGSPMPERTWSGDYRYGFQNQEQDQELWEGAVSFNYRVEDARLGRFFSVDPLHRKFPWNSTYAFSENMVIHLIELEGLESTTPDIQPTGPVEEEEIDLKVPESTPDWLNVEMTPYEPLWNLTESEKDLKDRFKESFNKEIAPEIEKIGPVVGSDKSRIEEPNKIVRDIADDIRDLNYSILEDSQGEYSNTTIITELNVTITNVDDKSISPYSVFEFYEGDHDDPERQFFIGAPTDGGTYFFQDANGVNWKVEVSMKLMIQPPNV